MPTVQTSERAYDLASTRGVQFLECFAFYVRVIRFDSCKDLSATENKVFVFSSFFSLAHSVGMGGTCVLRW